MPLLCHVKQFGKYNYILEDPDPRFNRIFIENQGFNVQDLTPRRNEFFDWQDTNNQVVGGPTTQSADFRDTPFVSTVGKCGLSWSDTRQAWYGGIGRWDPWLSVLDYQIPVQKIIRNPLTNSTHVFYPRATGMTQDYWVGETMTSPATYSVASQVDFITPLYLRNDGNWVCFNYDDTQPYISVMRLDKTSIAVSQIRTTGAQIFFLGRGNDGSGIFVDVDGTTHAYNVYKVGESNWNGSSFAGNSIGNSILPGGTITGGYSSVINQFPSNIKHSTTFPNRKVFYSSHWDSTGSSITPRRFIWDKSRSDISVTTCTITYPGITTCSNYVTPPTANNFSVSGNNVWWMKPHTFQSPNGQEYITFCTSEKSIHTYPTERWNTTSTQRGWVTYSINAAPNDDQMQYHSTLTWPTAYDMPRSWVPTSDLGDQLVVFQIGKTLTLNFNTVTGWVSSNFQDIDARSYGIDSVGRMYLVTRGQSTAVQTGDQSTLAGTGFNSIYTYDPNVIGGEFEISLPQVLNTYTGTTVITTATIVSTNAKTIVAWGDATTTRLNPFTTPGAGGWGVTFDGTGDRLTVTNSNDFNFGFADFTVEFWLWSRVAWTSQSALAGIVGQKTDDTRLGWQVGRNSTTGLWARINGTTDLSSAATVATQTWEHWVFQRIGTTIRFYKNGIPDTNTITVSTSTVNIIDPTAQFHIGYSQTWGQYFNGIISNLRIVKGLAVYTGFYTPPTSSLTATQAAGTNISAITTQTVLLTCQSPNLVDNSLNTFQAVKLVISGNSLTFDDDSKGPYIVITTATTATSVMLKIISTGSSYINVINAA
jgi:hypothetical protein